MAISTATSKDSLEIENWAKALHRFGEDFPMINATKSLIGHCLAAAGSIECVAGILQLYHQFIAPNVNCQDLHPEIETMISPKKIPTVRMDLKFNILAKASFGFGDVNACVLFKRYKA
jgi:3-oxoacyl-[acyl-carrier-protein] synthase-1